MINILDVIVIDGKRIFIDIAEKGCGNGCLYCYVDTASLPQKLWNRERVCRALDLLLKYEPFRSDPQSFIISLCPSTEPFKTENAYEIIRYILDALLPYGCIFQIATKEVLDPDFIYHIDEESLYIGQIVINISITTFNMANILEPNAVIPTDRLKNLKLIAQTKKIKSSVLIKPFIQTTYNEVSIFERMLKENLPDYVCAGIYFSSNCSKTSQDDDTFFLDNFTRCDEQLLLNFCERLKASCNIQVYPSTLCIANQIIPNIIEPIAAKTKLCCECWKCKGEKKDE